ncbi:MAG: branched-chain amino acid ABC transporter permease [Bradyrhizobium sp.]|nr:MAG: branched-chain amino acid ABC transporter permease [Bradyrhizobium sp.]
MSAFASDEAARVSRHLLRRRRWRPLEIAAWLAPPALILIFPSRALLINEILILGLFALSLDLALGFGGLVSLGHAAFLGIGAYTAGILASRGVNDPLLGLLIASALAGLAGLVTAPLVLRGADLTRLMVTLGVSLLLGELANRNAWITGGADGLDFTVGRLFGVFALDFTGRRAAALYSFVVLFVLFALARRVMRSSFGQSVQAVRQSRLRAGALGVPANRRLIAIYGLAAAYAGAAGALIAETTQIVSLDIFDFHRSADVLLMLIIGGPGYLYGGLIGAAIFVGLRDLISGATPEYWEFWIGLLLVALVSVGRERVEAALARFARRPYLTRPGEAAP